MLTSSPVVPVIGGGKLEVRIVKVMRRTSCCLEQGLTFWEDGELCGIEL